MPRKEHVLLKENMENAKTIAFFTAMDLENVFDYHITNSK